MKCGDMAPRRFRLSRIGLIMRDPTRLAEVMLALCNVIVPSTALAFGQSAFPMATENLLWELFLNNHVIGVSGILLGCAQLWGAGTNWYAFRSNVATAIFCGLIALVTAFILTGHDQRPTVPLMIGTIFGQMFVAWRTWHEKPDHNSGRDVLNGHRTG